MAEDAKKTVVGEEVQEQGQEQEVSSNPRLYVNKSEVENGFAPEGMIRSKDGLVEIAVPFVVEEVGATDEGEVKVNINCYGFVNQDDNQYKITFEVDVNEGSVNILADDGLVKLTSEDEEFAKKLENSLGQIAKDIEYIINTSMTIGGEETTAEEVQNG